MRTASCKAASGTNVATSASVNGSDWPARSSRSFASYASRVVLGAAAAIASYSEAKYESSLNRIPPTSRKTHSIGTRRMIEAVVGSRA